MDSKTRLQEWLQARGHRPPAYVVHAVAGEAHAQTFEVICDVEALGISAPGHGARLAPGRYAVTATAGSRSKAIEITVGEEMVDASVELPPWR